MMQQYNGHRVDIFDRLMQLPLLRRLYPFYRRNKEVLLYLFFGGIAFFLNIGIFVLLDRIFGIDELVNNAICWIICVLFQFFTNRIWVFDGYVDSVSGLIRQMAEFFGGRVFTLVIEELILVVFITWLCFDSVVVKLAAQVVVIILNYMISKMLIFKEHNG